MPNSNKFTGPTNLPVSGTDYDSPHTSGSTNFGDIVGLAEDTRTMIVRYSNPAIVSPRRIYIIK